MNTSHQDHTDTAVTVETDHADQVRSVGRPRPGRRSRSVIAALTVSAALLAGFTASSQPAAAAEFATPSIDCGLTQVKINPAVQAGYSFGYASGYYRMWLYASDGVSTWYTRQSAEGAVKGPDLSSWHEVAPPVTFNVQPGLLYTALVERWYLDGGVWRSYGRQWTRVMSSGYLANGYWCRARI